MNVSQIIEIGCNVTFAEVIPNMTIVLAAVKTKLKYNKHFGTDPSLHFSGLSIWKVFCKIISTKIVM